MRITESRLRQIIREELERAHALESNDEGGLEEAEGSAASREYKGKEYKASKGSVTALEKKGGSKKKAVASGAFDWAQNPYAAARAAEIVSTGKARSTRD